MKSARQCILICFPQENIFIVSYCILKRYIFPPFMLCVCLRFCQVYWFVVMQISLVHISKAIVSLFLCVEALDAAIIVLDFFFPISFDARPQNSADYMVIFPYQHHMPTTCPFHLNMECKKNNYNTSLYSYIVSMSRVKLLM